MGDLTRRQGITAVSTGAVGVSATGELRAADPSAEVNALRKRREELKKKAGGFVSKGENVLGVYHVHFLPERPDAGGAADGEFKVQPSTGTKNFLVWLAGFSIYFVDKKAGQSVERPVWVADVMWGGA